MGRTKGIRSIIFGAGLMLAMAALLPQALAQEAEDPVETPYDITWSLKREERLQHSVPADPAKGRDAGSQEASGLHLYEGSARVIHISDGTSTAANLHVKADYTYDLTSTWARVSPEKFCPDGWGLSSVFTRNFKIVDGSKYYNDPNPPNILRVSLLEDQNGRYIPYPLLDDDRKYEWEGTDSSVTQLCDGGSNSRTSPWTGYTMTGDEVFRQWKIPREIVGELRRNIYWNDEKQAYVLQVTKSTKPNYPSQPVFTYTFDIQIKPGNAAPKVEAGEDFETKVDEPVPLNGKVTDDGNPDPPGKVTSVWTVVSAPPEGTVEFADDTQPGTTAKFSHGGSYQLKLTGNDSQLKGSDTVTVTVKGKPTAKFTVKQQDQTLNGFTTHQFDASASTSPNGSIRSYGWSFGDGTLKLTKEPVVSHTYKKAGSFQVTLTIVDEDGQSSGPKSQELTVAHCGGTAAAATVLPAVNMSFDNLLKPVRIAYGELPIVFYASNTEEVPLCQMTGSGTLPVYIAVGPVLSPPSFVFNVRSVATASLDFLPEGSHAPVCDWSAIRTNCVVGGTGDRLVRWHTNGFVEYVDLPATGETKVWTSDPFTYYARVPGSSTFEQAVQIVEPLLHVELTHHLGYIDKLFMIQEPPAGLQVTDADGRITGLSGDGGQALQGIPASAYVSDNNGYSAVVLFSPEERPYVASALGAGSPYSLSIAEINPIASEANVADVRAYGTIGKSGKASICFSADSSCRSQYIYGGLKDSLKGTDGRSVKAGSSVPVRISLANLDGSALEGAVAKLEIAPVVDGKASGPYRTAEASGKANTAGTFRGTGAGSYLYNLSAKGLAPGEWNLRITLPDGGQYYERMTVSR